MYHKFKRNSNLDFNQILKTINDIIKKVLENKTLDEKKILSKKY